MSSHSWLQNLRSALAPSRGQRKFRRRGSLRAAKYGPNLEALEDRTLLSFSYPVGYTAGTNPEAVVTADFNKDGRLDLATANYSSYSVSVLLGNGDGTFQAARNYGAGYNPQSLAVGDFNRDGKLDLVTANGLVWDGKVSVLLGNGDGSFQPARTIPTGGSTARAVAVGDFNADGKLDLTVAGWNPATSPSYYYTNYYPGTPSTSEVTVLLGHGDGTFARASSRDLSGDFVSSIATADLNADGKPDLMWTDGDADAVGVLLSHGDGTIAAAAQYFATDGSVRSMAEADLNGDGVLDLVTANEIGSASVLLGKGDGTFQVARNYDAGNRPQALAVGDFNGDSKSDLVMANGGDDSVGVLLGNGDGLFRSAQSYAAGSIPLAVASGDFNGDGRPDLAVADYSAGVSVLLNTGGWPSFGAPSFQVGGFPSPTTAGQAHTLTVTALDSNGNLLPSYRGTVHFSSSDPQAVLPADYTFTAADQGVHTLSVTMKTSGTQAIILSDAAAGITGSESGIMVTAAAASTMSVAGFPSTITAGVAGSLTVTLTDSYGNIASGYRGTIHFTSSDPKASLPANYTFSAGDLGVHTFSAILKTAGARSITAADTATGGLTRTDGGIAVSPAQVSQFIITAPSSVTVGVAFSVTVTVEDAYGNAVTGYAGTIKFSGSDRNAKLPSKYTFKAADQGVHTFTGLVLQTTGKQTITITDPFLGLSGSLIVDVIAPKKK